MTTDEKLIKKYNQVFSEGQEKFFNLPSMEQYLLILKALDFQNKDVLEIGCGTGDFAAMMMAAGANLVHAFDMSAEAIKIARKKYSMERLSFSCGDPCSYDMPGSQARPYDIIVMVGVLEHTEKPNRVLDTILNRFMDPESILAVTCPLHINPRGIVWATCKYLFGVPMSLTDKHELQPSFFKRWASERGAGISDVHAVDQSYGTGPGMIEDLADRLPKALRDWTDELPVNWHAEEPDFKPRIDKLLKFLKDDLDSFPGHGANACYFITKFKQK